MRKLLVALGGLFLCLAANAQNTATGSLTASGTDCTTAGACITLQFESNDVASASIQLSGTFTATVQFEASSDKGTTWVAISGTPLNSSTAVTSATTANTWKFNVASITNIRARASAWTSAPTVIIRSSRAVANAIGGGGTSLPDVTDTAGVSVVSTVPVQVPVGTKAATGLQVGGAGDGLFANGSHVVQGASNGSAAWAYNSALWNFVSGMALQWVSSSTDPTQTADLSLTRDGGPGILALKQSATADGKFRVYGANGDFVEYGTNTELLTLSTVGATTDTTGNLLPANSVIDGVDARVTTTITTATDWKLGDATIAARFSIANSTLTAGTTQVGDLQADQTGTSGPRQVAAAKVRVTTTGTPGAGVIRITVHYHSFTPPTS